MKEIAATIAVNSKPAPDFFASLLEMEVEEDHYLAAVFRIKLAIYRKGDGRWAFLDDSRLQLWSKVKISVKVSNEVAELITGYITYIKPHFDPNENSSFIEIK